MAAKGYLSTKAKGRASASSRSSGFAQQGGAKARSPKGAPVKGGQFHGGPVQRHNPGTSTAAASANSGGSPGTPGTTAVTPYLTPAQQAALQNFNAGITSRIANDQQRMSDATYNTNQALAANQKVHDVNTNRTNQSDAARGIFQSSIRAGDLNDLDATLAMRNNIANTNLHRLMLSAQGDINSAITSAGITNNAYNQFAMQNAQAIPPIIPTTVTPTQPTAPTPNRQGQQPRMPHQRQPRQGRRGGGMMAQLGPQQRQGGTMMGQFGPASGAKGLGIPGAPTPRSGV